MSKLQAKQARAAEANRVVEAISNHGRRFFYCGPGSDPSEGGARAKKCPEGRVARFEVDERGAIWFRDDYSWERIYVAYEGRWKRFSHGGTLKSLVQALRDYIRTGEPIAPGWFGPWDEWIARGDLWGYGVEEMERLRAVIRTLPAVAAPRAPEPATAA